MILFTKEIFLELKSCTAIYVHLNQNIDYTSNPPIGRMDWQVVIRGQIQTGTTHTEPFEVYMNPGSKEDAHRLYKELAQQVIDSGKVPELNEKLVDNILRGD